MQLVKNQRLLSSFQGHLGTVTHTQIKMPLRLECFHHSRITFILRWDPSISTVLIDKGKECFTMTYWAFQGRHETSKSRNIIKYMCTHPHLSLSLYIKHIFLTLNFTALLSWQRMGKFLLSWALLSVLCTLLENLGGVSAFKTVMFKCTSLISNPTWMKRVSKINFSFSCHRDNQLWEHHTAWAVPGMWDFAEGDTNTCWFGMLILKHPKRGQKKWRQQLKSASYTFAR